MKRFRPKAWQSVLVLAALAPVLLDGCVSIGVSRSKTDGAQADIGSLEVIVVEKSGDVAPTAARVVTRLVRLESGIETPVFDSSDPTWTMSELPARRYRLYVSYWIDETGKARRFAKSDQESFKIRPGERVEARVVLNAFPTGPVITAAAFVGVGVLVAVLISSLRGLSFNLSGTSRSDTNLERDESKREQPRVSIRIYR